MNTLFTNLTKFGAIFVIIILYFITIKYISPEYLSWGTIIFSSIMMAGIITTVLFLANKYYFNTHESFTFQVSDGIKKCMEKSPGSSVQGCCPHGMNGIGNADPPEMTIGNWPHRPDLYDSKKLDKMNTTLQSNCDSKDKSSEDKSSEHKSSEDKSSEDKSSEDKSSEHFVKQDNYLLNAIRDANIVMYSKNNCSACDKTKQILQETGAVSYITIMDATQHLDTLKMSNVSGVPYFTCAYGNHQGACSDLHDLLVKLHIPKDTNDKPDSNQDKPYSNQDKPDSNQDKPDSNQDKPYSNQDKPDSNQDKPYSNQVNMIIDIPYDKLYKNDYISKKSGVKNYYTYGESFPDVIKGMQKDIMSIHDIYNCDK